LHPCPPFFLSAVFLEDLLTKLSRMKTRPPCFLLNGIYLTQELKLRINNYLPLLPEVYLITPWLLGEKYKPIIVCDADVALHFELILVSEKRAHLGLLGM
jgi:hypothetical protein